MIEEDREREDVDETEDSTEDSATKGDDSESKQPGYQIHSQTSEAGKKGNKIAAQVKSKMAAKGGSTGNQDSDDDVEDDDMRTVNTSNNQSVMTRDENQQKIVDKTSVVNEVTKKMEGIDLSGDTNGQSSFSGGTTECDTTSAMQVNIESQGSSKQESERGDGDNGKPGAKGGKQGSEKGGNESKNKGGNESEDKGGKSEVETELSWREVDRNSPFNPHKAQCGVNFTNDVMFDLDID